MPTDRRCEICGALSKPVSNFVYDAEYSYDDYYQTDSVKICPSSLKRECIDCHKEHHTDTTKI
ncbi:MAG TPA: hypothetical protein VE130_01920 [Nitrososphaeraceae archaeon]|nr:hypothetical protein [Nitrososphaeraceae archaeon]